jgi:hypothetical protein
MEIVQNGQNEFVDKLCTLLQYRSERARPMIAYARMGGPDGLRISRATFAVMIKYDNAISVFENLIDEIDLMLPDLTDLTGPAMCAMMVEKLQESEMEDDLKTIDKVW